MVLFARSSAVIDRRYRSKLRGRPPPVRISLRPSRSGLRPLVSRTAGQTEAEATEPVIWGVKAVSRDNSRLLGAVIPTAATIPADGGALQIPTPFKYISAHVINPELIRLFLSNWMRLSSRIIFRPTHGIQIIAPSISIFIRFFFPTARSPLPLRIC